MVNKGGLLAHLQKVVPVKWHSTSLYVVPLAGHGALIAALDLVFAARLGRAESLMMWVVLVGVLACEEMGTDTVMT